MGELLLCYAVINSRECPCLRELIADSPRPRELPNAYPTFPRN